MKTLTINYKKIVKIRMLIDEFISLIGNINKRILGISNEHFTCNRHITKYKNLKICDENLDPNKIEKNTSQLVNSTINGDYENLIKVRNRRILEDYKQRGQLITEEKLLLIDKDFIKEILREEDLKHFFCTKSKPKIFWIPKFPDNLLNMTVKNR